MTADGCGMSIQSFLISYFPVGAVSVALLTCRCVKVHQS